MIVLGPPRSGKGYNIVIPMLLDAPGAVITTATRADNLSATITARAAHGPVGVFDPEGLAAGVPSALRWSPVRGCERPQTAMIRANALCAESAGGTESGSFWKQQTTMAVRCLLHAAALEDRPPVDLYRWSLSPAAAKEAVDILVHTPRAALAWDKALDAIVSADQRQRDSVWAMVANAFAALADPGVLDAVSPGPGETFDPAEFLRQRGTLYLLGTASGASATAGLVAALVEDLVDVARRLAARSTGARLDPPLGLILDEAANYPLPSLGALMSEGGGTGITTLAVLQSLAQARHRWGREQAQGIWDSAIVKIVLGGGSNADDLADIARLVGDRTEREFSQTAQSGGGRSISTSNRERAILDPSAIRAITPGHGLLLLRSARPIMLIAAPVDGAPLMPPQLQRDRAARRRCHSHRRRDRVGRAMRDPRPGLIWSIASPSSPGRLLRLHGQPAVVCAHGNGGRRTGRLATASNPVVSSAVSRGRSSEDIFTTAVTPVSVTRGLRDLIPLCRMLPYGACTGSSNPIGRGAGSTEPKPRI